VKTIGIFPNTSKEKWLEITGRIIDIVAKRGMRVVLEPPQLRRNFPKAKCISPDLTLRDSDLAIALGGDGTMLTLARVVGRHGIPIMGINLGGLGFLAEFSTKNLTSSLKEVLKGRYNISRRITIKNRLLRGERIRYNPPALNEVVISSPTLSRIIDLKLYVDNECVTTFRADGLIVATPTGSTAYSLSAGGPIVIPEMRSLLVTPINPHMLTNRPLLISGDKKIRVELPTDDENFMMTIDGQVGVKLKKGDVVELMGSDKYVNLITSKHRSYFEILRSKLGWGGSKNVLR